MNFIKKHKIVTGIVLVLLLAMGACTWFVADKLERISYSDGKPEPSAEGTAAAGG